MSFDDPSPRPFLGVARSLGGRRWIGPAPDLERRAEGLAQLSALPLPIARVLAERGVDHDAAAGHLEPRLRDLLPDPLRLRDMGAAAERIVAAALSGQRIAVCRITCSARATPAGDRSPRSSARSASRSLSVRQRISGVDQPTPRGSKETMSN